MRYRILPTEQAWKLAWYLVWLERQNEKTVVSCHRLSHSPFPAQLYFAGRWWPPSVEGDTWLLDVVRPKNRPTAKYRRRQKRPLSFWGKMRKTLRLIRQHYSRRGRLESRLATFVGRDVTYGPPKKAAAGRPYDRYAR